MRKLSHTMKTLTVLSACLIASQMLSGCQSGSAAGAGQTAQAPRLEGRAVYTRVCLHTEYRGGVYKAYSTNHIGVPDKFPAGTQLQVLEIDSDEVKLLDPKTKRKIAIKFVQKHNLMPIGEWFAETFSEAPVSLPTLTPAERENVEACRAQIGMSRTALFLALGYPPASLTPSRNGPTLTYEWKRFNRQVFAFGSDNNVTSIKD